MAKNSIFPVQVAKDIISDCNRELYEHFDVKLFEPENCSACVRVQLEAVEKPAMGSVKVRSLLRSTWLVSNCVASAACGTVIQSSHLSQSERATQNYFATYC